MVSDGNNVIVHMSTEEAETYEEVAIDPIYKYTAVANIPDIQVDPKEVDDELGLEVVEKLSIFDKYGVQCNPDKNSFHRSLFTQYEKKGYLSPKQIDALR